MEFKLNDFVKINFDLYANGKFVQTTDSKKASENGFQEGSYGPYFMILGKGFILKSLDDDIVKNGKDFNSLKTLNLVSSEAYGKRDKSLLKTFPKSVFDEKNLRVVVGVTYDFNGTYGTVKSLVGGRVLVDFNNPLSGKEIKIDYSVVEKIENFSDKVNLIFSEVLKIPAEAYSIESKDKSLKVSLKNELFSLKDILSKNIEELVGEETFKENTITFEKFEDKNSKKENSSEKKEKVKEDNKEKKTKK